MHRIDPHVATVAPAELPERIEEHRDAILTFSIGLPVGSDQHADAPHPLTRLRASRERPRRRRAAEQRDELAAFQSIELHSIPASQGRIAGYRISNGQSAGIRSRAGPELGRDDERRELAAGPWPRKVRGGIPRK